jgi:glycosyltransferase involved in cell wall biosynthesis
MKKSILFIHQSFPGQFGHLAKKLAQDGHRVTALALTPQKQVPGVSQVRYTLARRPHKDLPRLLQETDVKILRAESAAIAMTKLKEQGLTPDVVYAHPGWGEALFVKEVWPDTRLVIYAEWFYNTRGQEVGFDPEFPSPSGNNQWRIQLKNTPFLHALNQADLAITPTHWQKSRFPAWAQEKITVVHDGLDIPTITGSKPTALRIPEKSIALKYGDPIVSFVARHLEPVRGIHMFMRAIPEILDKRPDVHIFVLGNDAGTKNIGYGAANPLGKTWRQSLQDELGATTDLSNIHFLGHVDYAVYLSVLRLSTCHAYLTTPFILSWSFLETAALGVPIVASDTAPVREFSHLKGVDLVSFFDYAALGSAIANRLNQPVTRTPNDLKNQSLAVTLPILTDLLLNPETRVRDQDPDPGRNPVQELVEVQEQKQEPVPAVSPRSNPALSKKSRKKKRKRK